MSVTQPDRDREDLAAFLLRLRAQHISVPRLDEVVEAVPRRMFLRSGMKTAYGDRSVPIDCGETMPGASASVALVHALRVEPASRILEVGTGSGYLTALLAKLGARVTTLDRYRRLLKAADERLKACGITNAVLVHEDGREGYPDAAPYDRIIVHASCETLPRAFLEQLAQHGQIVCALGPGGGRQTLVRLQKVGSRLEREDLGHVRYQPLAAGIARIL
ncbi:MAG: protein-L-isoaspartate(D-aspartate) O-methyltransferase [Rhizobiaceae bacterium]|nr:protein-L-isoaspartate(D-aspartate) O-methyltransferase [Rhizobiaceae bacterium]